MSGKSQKQTANVIVDNADQANLCQPLQGAIQLESQRTQNGNKTFLV